MRDAFDDNGNPLPYRIRLTRVGQWVRSASLDELLQLINVLQPSSKSYSYTGIVPTLVNNSPIETSLLSVRSLILFSSTQTQKKLEIF